MTTVTNTANASGALTSLAGGNAALNNVNFDTFLKLLVAQLKNQDPLNPMEGTEFTSQIAQFSSLEQQINGNNYLKEILAQRDFGEQTLANTYLGKEVLGPGNLLVTDGGKQTIAYEVDKKARAVTVDIINNANGQVVHSFKGDVSGGVKGYIWDGKDANGTQLPAGKFTLRARATDIDGKVVPSQTYVFDEVTSVFKNGDAVTLQMKNGQEIAASSVAGVRNK